jgi:hypothetical protein
MGLLDDAIRDHLDLKRRRGADPGDIERAEQEALGPVRRDPFERGPDDFESVPASDDGPRAYDQDEERYDDEAYEEYDVEEEWEGGFEDQPLEPAASQSPAGDAPAAREDEFADPTRLMDHEALDEAEPSYPDAPESYQAETGAGDETMQYDVEEALAAEGTHAEPEADWVEGSEEWEEPSHEPVESSHESLEPSHEPVESPHEPPEPPPADKAPTFESPTEPEEAPADKAPTFESPTEPEEAPHRFESGVAGPGVQDDPGADRPETDRPEGEAKDDDILEETPEFLQDAPDHDRLWFEQRPPKDFDFDG